MSWVLLSRIAAWLLRVLKVMPSMGSVLLRILRPILPPYPNASSPQKHCESNTFRTLCASSMPFSLEQRETNEVSPSQMHPPSINDTSRGTDLATQSNDSMNGNLPVHYHPSPVLVQPVGDELRAASCRRLVPASPQQVMKHSSRIENSDDECESDKLLKEGDMNYEPPSLPIGWMKYTQPEGAPYYLHGEKRIITDLTEPQQLVELVGISNRLLHRARDMGLPLHLDVEVVITKVLGPEKKRDYGYYFIDHRRRLLFWVHDYDLSHIFFNVKGVTARDHMKQAVVTQYWWAPSLSWMHIELYPNRRELKANDHEELKNILTYAIADAVTSNTPLAPFDLESMTRMLDLVEKLEGSIGKENPYAVWVIGTRYSTFLHRFSNLRPARFAREFSRSRFINFSGQPCARLDADQCIYASHHHPSRSGSSFLIRTFDLFLFQSASVYLKELRQMWVDQIVHYPRWQKYIAKLTSEWARFTIFSTVLLTADVGLLAVPALGGGGGGPGGGSGGTPTNNTGNSTSGGPSPPMALQMTPAIASTYLSILFSVASILTSIQLTNRVGGKEYASAAATSALLERTDKSLFGTDWLAIMYSLPYAFLVWGYDPIPLVAKYIFLFVLGMSLLIFSSTNHAMLAALAPFFFLLFVFSIWPSISGLGIYGTLEKLWQDGEVWHWLCYSERKPRIRRRSSLKKIPQ
ncbi:hypothetical protein EV401DRAFT_1893024 [Pisolithus croceorrhizus]|nr:hypothetical protein EV401DRAFT_1893024 [Pisolithus croceorrhizus]